MRKEPIGIQKQERIAFLAHRKTEQKGSLTMKGFFKRVLPLLLALLLIAGSIPFVANAEVSPQVLLPDEEVTLDFNDHSDEMVFSFTPEESGYYLFSSESKYEDPVGSVWLDGTELSRCDDAYGKNFRVVCQMEAGTEYQPAVHIWNGFVAMDGIVKVKITKIPETVVDVDTSKAVTFDASCPAMLFTLTHPEGNYYLASLAASSSSLQAYFYENRDTMLFITSFKENDSFLKYFSEGFTYHVLVYAVVPLEESVPLTFSFQTPPPATGMTLNYTEYEGTVGETFNLDEIFVPTYSLPEEVEWSSSDSEVASVTTGGEVFLLKKGTATITATTDNFSASCTVTVGDALTILPCVVTRIPVEEAGKDIPLRFVPDKSGTYSFISSDIDGLSSDPRIEVYGVAIQELLFDADDTDESFHFVLTVDLEADKEYLLVLSSYNGADFNLQIRAPYGDGFCHFVDENGLDFNSHGHFGVCHYCGEFEEDHTAGEDGSCIVCGYVQSDLGDANEDGTVDVSDVTELLKILSGTYTEEVSENADVDLSGDLDISDVTELLKILSGE